jgi:hypothetical protein
MPHSQQPTAENRIQPYKTAEIDRQLIDEFIGSQGLEHKRKKALKGTVVIYVDKGWLRLRWAWGRQRYFLANRSTRYSSQSGHCRTQSQAN